MGKPAARVNDMHICPMVTGVVPHVGGPILPPGAPTVLIGNLPAACMGDLCVCNGPPDNILFGSFTVLIGGKPAATLGEMTAHGGTITVGMPTVLIGGSPTIDPTIPRDILIKLSKLFSYVLGRTDTPLTNPKVQELILLSPTLSKHIAELTQDGWVVIYGERDKGSYCERGEKNITIDPNNAANGVAMTQILAHEAGHAKYEEPYVSFKGRSRDEYASKNANRDLRDEGEATLTNAEVREEINSNGGDDIGVAGAHSEKYKEIYNDSKETGNRDQARQEIGDIFADNERPSTAPEKTYREYYEDWYKNNYDENTKK